MYNDSALTLAGSITYPAGAYTLAGQSIIGSGTINSANVIDLSSGATLPTGAYAPLGSAQVRDAGAGFGNYLRLQLTQAVAGATSVEFQAIQHDDTAQSVNVNVVGSTGAIPVASLTSGARFLAEISPRLGGKLGQRYLSMRAVVTGTATTGAVFADLGTEYQDGAKFYSTGSAVV